MTSEDNKTFSLTLSPTMMVTILLAVISALGSGGYYGITQFNRAMAAIEAVEGYKPYDDAELVSKVQKLEIESSNAKDRFLTLADTTNKLTEKVANVSIVSTEAKVLAESTSREVNSRLVGLKQELDSTASSLKNDMNNLRKASTNPLGR
jgi:hypothetical protein